MMMQGKEQEGGALPESLTPLSHKARMSGDRAIWWMQSPESGSTRRKVRRGEGASSARLTQRVKKWRLQLRCSLLNKVTGIHKD